MFELAARRTGGEAGDYFLRGSGCLERGTCTDPARRLIGGLNLPSRQRTASNRPMRRWRGKGADPLRGQAADPWADTVCPLHNLPPPHPHTHSGTFPGPSPVGGRKRYAKGRIPYGDRLPSGGRQTIRGRTPSAPTQYKWAAKLCHNRIAPDWLRGQPVRGIFYFPATVLSLPHPISSKMD